ncbi:glutathione s-transferase like [Lecanosticta acicola]|uniref:Glutathione s-transferase like n=1 Tax=Lecanosticta acicola TaxID=111012 RepID=A0AAI8YVH9_9PEZI|nr:glutathione s-transferase like [Lecanosticta acicola]
MSSGPVIHYDYDFSPYGQKTKMLLKAAGIDYHKVDVPAVLPRPELEKLGITYRRIPVLAVGKDVYADSDLIFQVVTKKLAPGKVPASPADDAYNAWGKQVFSDILSLIPGEVLTDGFVKDRAAVFPFLKRPDILTLRPSGLAQFRQRMMQIENEFLSHGGPFIGGNKLSLADIHVMWPVKWVLNELNAKAEPGVGKNDFPKTWKLAESLPTFEPPVLSADDAAKTITGAQYTANGPSSVQNGDPLGLAAGTPVNVESFDTDPGAHPQAGKLFATSDEETVIELKDGVRLHFPRIGYVVRDQATKW